MSQWGSGLGGEEKSSVPCMADYAWRIRFLLTPPLFSNPFVEMTIFKNNI